MGTLGHRRRSPRIAAPSIFARAVLVSACAASVARCSSSTQMDDAGASQDAIAADVAPDDSNTDAAVACNSAAQCPAGTVCDFFRGQCVSCVRNSNCPASAPICTSAGCVVATPCVSSRTCEGQVCDPTLGVCVDCLSTADCPTGMVCRYDVCGPPPMLCNSDRQCTPQGLVCSPTLFVCVECVHDVDCTNGQVCRDSACETIVDAGLDGGTDASDVAGGDGIDGAGDGSVIDLVETAPEAAVDANPCTGTICDGVCVDLATDSNHCGACGTVCPTGQRCVASACSTLRFSGATASSWETIAAGGGEQYPGYTDYSPAGAARFFAYSDVLEEFSTTGATWTVDMAPPPVAPTEAYFAGPAWVGNALYLIVAGLVIRYDIPSTLWTTVLTGVGNSTNAQNAHDDAGHLYALLDDDRIATFDIATSVITYQSFVAVPRVAIPRVAWDSPTHLLYVVPDLEQPNFYSFDPPTGTVVPLAPVPEINVSPIFCSDRSGHIYTTSDNGASTTIWQYSTGTNTWARIPPLPFGAGSNGACTVTDDGYLYVTDTGMNLARIALM